MRRALWAIILVALATSYTLGASAFNYSTTARAVSVTIAGDSAAYLAVAANGASPHRCFVDTTNGKISILFDTPSAGCGAGTGTGINPGDGSTSGRYSRYAFHDLLVITNKAPHAIVVWVNTTALGSESALDVALETASGQMTDAKYSNAETVSGLSVGATTYLGVRVKSGTLSSGSVTSSISLEARR